MPHVKHVKNIRVGLQPHYSSGETLLHRQSKSFISFCIFHFAVGRDRAGPGSQVSVKPPAVWTPTDPIKPDRRRFLHRDWSSTSALWEFERGQMPHYPINELAAGPSGALSNCFLSEGGGTERGGGGECSIRRGRGETLATTTEPKQGASS